jgi:hypothetical protein
MFLTGTKSLAIGSALLTAKNAYINLVVVTVHGYLDQKILQETYSAQI